PSTRPSRRAARPRAPSMRSGSSASSWTGPARSGTPTRRSRSTCASGWCSALSRARSCTGRPSSQPSASGGTRSSTSSGTCASATSCADSGVTGIRPPQQKRSRASLERVLAAGTQLLEEEGWEAFTLAEVSRRAGVSIGSIYARMPSKDALFRAIQEHSLQMIAELAATFEADARIVSVIMHRGAVDDAVAGRSSERLRALGDRFRALLLTRREEFVHGEPELAADVAFRTAYGTLARQIMYGPTFESPNAIPWDRLVGEHGDACGTYLFGV